MIKNYKTDAEEYKIKSEDFFLSSQPSHTFQVEILLIPSNVLPDNLHII